MALPLDSAVVEDPATQKNFERLAGEVATDADLLAHINEGVTAHHGIVASSNGTANNLALTGNPTAPTAPADDADTSVATTAFVTGQAASASPLMDGAVAVGTSLRYARGDHRHPTDTTLAPIASPTFTGDPKAPTPTAGDNDTSIATTAFVTGALASYALLASPALTGNPTAPTPSTGDNDTSIATTAFVTAAVAAGIPPGVMFDYVASTAPTGFLLCDGTSVLRATYPALFAVIGTTFGSVDSTHFTLPDFRGRVPVGVGQGASLTNRVLAASGGEEAHFLTIAEMPSHDHGGATGAMSSGASQSWAALGLAGHWFTEAVQTGINNTTTNIDHSHSISFQGGAGSHNTMPPFLVVTKIIKT